MADSTLWVAAITGGTAVVASWMTGQYTTRAAREQAQCSADAHRQEKLREIQRTAYLDLIQHAQSLAPMERNISELIELPASEERTAELKKQIVVAHKARFDFLALKRVIFLEGAPQVKKCADELDHLFRDYCVTLEQAINGDEGAPYRLDLLYKQGDEALQRLILEAGRSLHSM
ncbi:hypothetical protein STRCI_004335 [Streptomyces cinnabarinus]|uniref:Uncharacterized protein n=1 Tax=Streptomyces cinnabarinus TaxID=67287 RepID=A0ABY7KET9_9ACTN|nr:hypothetical protein [Streptomyces cinnabarinus]WAZ23023.1 hypothetical protein STRCI_004335 [Streptomyces cinnabarinus]